MYGVLLRVTPLRPDVSTLHRNNLFIARTARNGVTPLAHHMSQPNTDSTSCFAYSFRCLSKNLMRSAAVGGGSSENANPLLWYQDATKTGYGICGETLRRHMLILP